MNLFIIIASLILFYENYIYGFETQELNGIDVLAALKSKVENCDLKSFVSSNNDYTLLVDNLKNYCSLEESVKQYRLLCYMLSYALEKACRLKDKSRLPKIEYATSLPSLEEICGKRWMTLTSQWIWNTITDHRRKQNDINSTNLCLAVTNNNSTRRLAAFFYKIGRVVRKADGSQQDKG